VKDELLAVTQGHGTAWEPLTELILARKVNAALGGVLVGPWDIPHMDDATLGIMTSYIDDLPAMSAGWSKVQAARAKWRDSHPTYGKHRRGMRH